MARPFGLGLASSRSSHSFLASPSLPLHVVLARLVKNSWSMDQHIVVSKRQGGGSCSTERGRWHCECILHSVRLVWNPQGLVLDKKWGCKCTTMAKLSKLTRSYTVYTSLGRKKIITGIAVQLQSSWKKLALIILNILSAYVSVLYKKKYVVVKHIIIILSWFLFHIRLYVLLLLCLYYSKIGI